MKHTSKAENILKGTDGKTKVEDLFPRCCFREIFFTPFREMEGESAIFITPIGPDGLMLMRQSEGPAKTITPYGSKFHLHQPADI